MRFLVFSGCHELSRGWGTKASNIHQHLRCGQSLSALVLLIAERPNLLRFVRVKRGQDANWDLNRQGLTKWTPLPETRVLQESCMLHIYRLQEYARVISSQESQKHNSSLSLPIPVPVPVLLHLPTPLCLSLHVCSCVPLGTSGDGILS